MPEEPKPSLVIDDRELKSSTARRLFSLGVQLLPRRLEVADYLISDKVGVERKTAQDFENSIIDGRLFFQARDLSVNFEAPLVAVIGRDFFRLSPKAVLGAQISLATDYRIPLFFFESEEQFADFLHVLVLQKLKPPKDQALRFNKPSLTLPQQQQFIVESLPGVGPTLAKALLLRLGSVQKVFKASLSQLQKAEGVGEGKAAAIRSVIEAPYAKD